MHSTRTFDTTVVESDDLQLRSVPLGIAEEKTVPSGTDIYVCVQRVDDWRRGKDFIYRLLTSDDTRELNECVLGLISSGDHGTKVGLLRLKYSLAAQSMQLIDSVENDILQSELTQCDRAHRVTCHFLVFVALVLEPDFIQYALLGTYNREAMRYYVNDVLRPALARLLTGNLLHESHEEHHMFDILTFVRQARHTYSLYCLPKHVDSTI
jgi:hypothetical protein